MPIQNSTYTSGDISLIEALQSIDAELENEDFKVAITSGVKEALEDNKALPIFLYLLSILPGLSKVYFEVGYDTQLEKRLWPTKTAYEEMFSAFLNAMQLIKATGLSKVRTQLAANKLPFKGKSYEILIDFLYDNRPKIKKYLSLDANRYFNILYRILMAEELPEKDLEYISTYAIKVPNKLLTKLLQSMDTSVDPLEVLKSAKIQEVNITKKYLKTTSPTSTQIKEFQEKSPDSFKEWRKTVQSVKKLAKLALEKAWNDADYDIEPVAKARKLCKDIGIVCPIDTDFIGKVGLGSTESMLFTYYTKYGEELDSVVGSNVIMNPKYTSADNTYYCTHMPFISKTGIPVKIYTKKHRSKSAQKLHESARDVLNVIEDVRTTLIKDSNPIASNNFTSKALMALVCRVLDLTGGRMGNRVSEKTAKTFGIHNLQVKHVNLKGGQIVLSYTGKKGVKQRHIIDDTQVVKAISNLIQGRKPSQYIFSIDGTSPISDTSVSNYLKSTGFPGSPHRWRKYHANRIFNEVIQAKEASSRPHVEAAFKAAIEQVAKFLGNEPNTSIKSYIDPLLMKSYFDRHNTPMPKTVQKAYDNMAGQNPDSDD